MEAKDKLFTVVLCTVIYFASYGIAQSRNVPICLPEDEYVTAGPECYNFYSCRYGVLEIVPCPSDLLWNATISRCDLPENVVCENEQTTTTTMAPVTDPPTPEPTTSEPTTLEPTTLEPTTLEPTTLEPTTLEPTTLEPPISFLPEVEGALPIMFPGSECPEDIRAFLIHATDCRRYYFCLYGVKYPQTCPLLHTFNYIRGHCVPQDESVCFPGSS